jgi:hypothetical protein
MGAPDPGGPQPGPHEGCLNTTRSNCEACGFGIRFASRHGTVSVWFAVDHWSGLDPSGESSMWRTVPWRSPIPPNFPHAWLAKSPNSLVIRDDMGDQMTDAQAHIEAMQRRLEKMAAREEQLIAALDDALSRADRKLLDDVRAITLEHETRRAVIFNELQSLATRVGSFPASPKPVETIEYDSVAGTPGQLAPASRPLPVGEALPSRGGDWRAATRRIAEELNLALNGAPEYGSDPRAVEPSTT